ncbi:MAG: hypothetical protein VKJ24_02610 [Synechococcales bacterium]|nr:hypothetical protein [Synechococcales bacterium]
MKYFTHNSPKIHQNDWQLDQVLPIAYQIPAHYLQTATTERQQSFSTLLSRDVFSEGDAQALYDYLMQRKTQWSAAFLKMLSPWLEDELKHYEALRRTYHVISGTSFAAMNQSFHARTHEIEPIAPVLVDEFTILVTLIFDEIGSVYSYRRDLREYYCHFGPAIQQIGHHLVKDEGTHFNNAAEILLTHHTDRLSQVEPLLHTIATLETHLGKYYKTFLLDHAQEQFRFPPQFNRVIIQVVLARLGLAQHPSQTTLRQLWQWTPPGHTWTPIAS